MVAPLRRALTGHAEIDRQHGHLSGLIATLADICPRPAVGAGCVDCTPIQRLDCSNRLAELLGELIAFMVDHFRYEETLMRSLPLTEDSKEHIAAHKRAHSSVSRHLSELANEFDETNPMGMALRLSAVLRQWAGEHAAEMDNELVGKIESDFDVELADFLALGP